MCKNVEITENNVDKMNIKLYLLSLKSSANTEVENYV